MNVPAGGEPDYLCLPASPGVCVFEGATSASGGVPTVLIATTANVRELARRRLQAADPALGRIKQADHRAITARVLATVAASSLEADAIYLRQARERLPLAYKVVSERWRAWFVHVDPGAATPKWSKTNLVGFVAPRSASTGRAAGAGVLLGPLPDKDSAGRLIELAIDTFDLCRYEHVLAQAPQGTACAYKEMGRCPAPCDGSEAMEVYRGRVREAVETLAGGAEGVQANAESVRALMEQAAAAGDFEVAARHKKVLDRLGKLARREFEQLAQLDHWRLLILLPSAEPRMVRCVGWIALTGTLVRLADVAADDRDGFAKVCERVKTLAVVAAEPPMDAEMIDSIGLVTRWLFLPAKKRRGVVFLVDELEPGRLVKAARQLGKGSALADSAADQVIEG